MEKKYEIIESLSIDYEGHKLYRIKALKDFCKTKNGYRVHKGDFGGYIESEDNLSQEGECWVFMNAIAYENAVITDDARLAGCSKVYGNAKICNSAVICGTASVCGNAVIKGKSYVCYNAFVSDDAVVTDNANISGNVKILNSSYIGGYAKIQENSKVVGNSKVIDALINGYHIVYDVEINGRVQTDKERVVNESSTEEEKLLGALIIKNEFTKEKYLMPIVEKEENTEE